MPPSLPSPPPLVELLLLLPHETSPTAATAARTKTAITPPSFFKVPPPSSRCWGFSPAATPPQHRHVRQARGQSFHRALTSWPRASAPLRRRWRLPRNRQQKTSFAAT